MFFYGFVLHLDIFLCVSVLFFLVFFGLIRILYFVYGTSIIVFLRLVFMVLPKYTLYLPW